MKQYNTINKEYNCFYVIDVTFMKTDPELGHKQFLHSSVTQRHYLK